MRSTLSTFTKHTVRHKSLQLCVLGFGLLQDGDVGIGVFPEREEVFVGSECPDTGGVGIGSLRGSRLQGIGTSHSGTISMRVLKSTVLIQGSLDSIQIAAQGRGTLSEEA